MTTTKFITRAEAIAQGLDRYFTGKACKHGHVAERQTDSATCMTCRRDITVKGHAKRAERRRTDTEYRGALNAYKRERHNNVPAARGNTNEARAAFKWCKATGGTLSGLYDLERPALQKIYAELPKGMEAEHGVAKKATDSAGRPVASGLHTFANIDGMASKANKWKRTSFDDLRDRRQRSANRYPMGAFDAYPTEYEWSLIADQCADRPETMTFDGVEFVDVIEGTDMETLLETLRLDLDRKARAHESHVGTLSKLARNTKGLRRGTKARWAAKVNMPEVAPVDVPAMIERRTEEVCNMVVLLIAAQAMMQGFDLTAVAANDEQMKEAA